MASTDPRMQRFYGCANESEERRMLYSKMLDIEDMLTAQNLERQKEHKAIGGLVTLALKPIKSLLEEGFRKIKAKTDKL